MSEKEKEKDKKSNMEEKDAHRESRRVRDRARARVAETAKKERAGRHVNEAGGVDLKRRQPADLARRFIESLSGRERRAVLDQLTGELMMKRGWRHPISVAAYSNYHRCTACGGEFSDEVVMVTIRTRSGDRHYVFCSKACLSNYDDGW